MAGEFSNISNFLISEIEESGLSQIQPIVPLQEALPTFSKFIDQFSTESKSTCTFYHTDEEGHQLSLQDHRKSNYRIGLKFGTPNLADMRVKFQVRIFTTI